MTQIVHGLPALRQILVDALLARRDLKAKRGHRQSGEVIEFLCPRTDHDDSSASAFLGEFGGKCDGCGAGWNLKELAALLGLDVQLGTGPRDYTLADYAAAKGFEVPTLERWGLVSGPDPWRGANEVVYIPYYGLDGTLIRRRVRVKATPGRSDKFWEGGQQGIPGLYGLWLLAAQPGLPVILVEGESDCHALWSVGVLALGVPGANTWQPTWADALRGRTVYVWQEPGQAGAEMVRAVASDFPEARVLKIEGVKDPCQLRQKDPDAFRQTMLRLMAEARAVGTPDPPKAFVPLSGSTLERMKEDRLQPLSAIPTPFSIWNHACRGRGGRVGLGRGWYVVIGGKQGSLKTMLALNLAVYGFMAGEQAAIISLEMDEDENAVRILPMVSGVPTYELEHGDGFQPLSWDRAARTMERIEEDTGGQLIVNQETISTLDDIESCMLYYAKYRGVRKFVVDYLQLAWVKDAGGMIHEQVTETSKVIRRITHQHRLVTVALSQLTQEAAKAPSTPITQNLMGGGALGADATQVLLLDHSRVRQCFDTVGVGDSQVRTRNGDIETVLVLDKNRHGPSKLDIPVLYESRTNRILPRRVAEGQEW